MKGRLPALSDASLPPHKIPFPFVTYGSSAVGIRYGGRDPTVAPLAAKL